MSIAVLSQIDSIIYNIDSVLGSKDNVNIPRQSFPNTSLDFQCRRWTSLSKHIRSNLEYENFQMFGTCLRVKYPEQTVKFFTDNFGMYLLSKKEYKKLGVTHYLLISPRSEKERNNLPPTSSVEAEEILWKYAGGVLQLRYDHGTEDNKEFKINSGNVKPFRGFGHIAFNTDDVYAACEELEKNNVSFKKKPNEGRMKGLAFVYDPNGYWIEIVKRDKNTSFECKYNLSQTMIRIQNPEKSLQFYCDILGMRLLCERHFAKGKFSLYFLSSFNDHINLDKLVGDDRYKCMKQQFHPIIELTHNWGTEDDDNGDREVYHNGNEQCELGVGFAQISFLVNNLKKTVQRLKENHIEIKELPKYLAHKEGKNGFTFISDPNDYTIEILQRGESPVFPYYLLSLQGLNEIHRVLNHPDARLKKRIFLLFCGNIDKNTHASWCPDCANAQPIINKYMHLLNKDNDVFITVYIGEKDEWKDKNCIFRTDKRFKLNSIPTLIEYNTQQRLVECSNKELIQKMLKEN